MRFLLAVKSRGLDVLPDCLLFMAKKCALALMKAEKTSD